MQNVPSGFPVANVNDIAVSNAETVSIPQGTPLVFKLGVTKNPSSYTNGHPAGYYDGLYVVLPSTAGATSDLFGCGVALGNIAIGVMGKARTGGIISYALLKRGTRAATTDSWASSAALAASVLMAKDTVNNVFSTVASSAGLKYPILLDSAAIYTGAASNAGPTGTANPTGTAYIVAVRAFMRGM